MEEELNNKIINKQKQKQKQKNKHARDLQLTISVAREPTMLSF